MSDSPYHLDLIERAAAEYEENDGTITVTTAAEMIEAGLIVDQILNYIEEINNG
jgi:hypothetical protein